MCTVCGCGQASVSGRPVSGPAGQDHPHHHHDHHQHGHGHHHDHDHDHDHRHDLASRDTRAPLADGGVHHYGHGPGGAHVPGFDQARIVRVERDILDANDTRAAQTRALFSDRGILALNLVSSPGSGKTTLLTRTLADLAGRMPLAVIEGDQQTSLDAERIRATGVPALQVNTGKGCHLDADMVARAVDTLKPADGAVMFIENVGNLVCPAAFDLGEAHKVVILSVTEGEDKPLKYPDMFAAADLMILTKMDLLPHVSFDVERCVDFARRVNPGLAVLRVSATRGDGLAAWRDWILARRASLPSPVTERTAS